MPVEFELSFTFQGLSSDVAAQRLEDFFWGEGYARVENADGWHWVRGGSWPKSEIERIRTHVYARLHPLHDAVRLDLSYKVGAPQALIAQIDRMYWQLELRALRTLLAGEMVPEWKSVYLACRSGLARRISCLNLLLLGPLTVLLGPLGCGFYLLIESLVSPDSLRCFFIASSGFVGLVLVGVFLVNLVRPVQDADALWQEAERQLQEIYDRV